MSAAIKTPGSVFAKLIEQQGQSKKEGAARGDGFCYFVGGRSSGKSTLLNRFLYPNRVSTYKHTHTQSWRRRRILRHGMKRVSSSSTAQQTPRSWFIP